MDTKHIFLSTGISSAHKYVTALAVSATLVLSACDLGSSDSDGEQPALDCVAFSATKKEDSSYRHKVHNLCSKTLQILEKSSGQRFAIPENRNVEIVLSTATPDLAACYDPKQPRVQDDGDFKCKKP